MIDNTTRDQFVNRYVSLNARRQEVFLADIAFWLTIAGRTTYDPEGTGIADGSKMQAINEANHRVLSHLAHLMAGHEQRRPDAAFANLLVDLLERAGLGPAALPALLRERP